MASLEHSSKHFRQSHLEVCASREGACSMTAAGKPVLMHVSMHILMVHMHACGGHKNGGPATCFGNSTPLSKEFGMVRVDARPSRQLA